MAVFSIVMLVFGGGNPLISTVVFVRPCPVPPYCSPSAPPLQSIGSRTQRHDALPRRRPSCRCLTHGEPAFWQSPIWTHFFQKRNHKYHFFFWNPTTPGLGDLRSPLPTTYSTRMILQSKRSFPPSKMIQSFKKLNGFLQTAWSFVPSILQITRVNWSILLQPPGRTQTKKRFKPQNRGQTGSRYVYSIYIYKYKCVYIICMYIYKK